ncbi:hypothetical protein CBM2585_B80218 [Cupriavidus taiwanensis]|nr:hypothetical protein CBM2585_B80218 [Cupriavidus taiwanensis]
MKPLTKPFVPIGCRNLVDAFFHEGTDVLPKVLSRKFGTNPQHVLTFPFRIVPIQWRPIQHKATQSKFPPSIVLSPLACILIVDFVRLHFTWRTPIWMSLHAIPVKDHVATVATGPKNIDRSRRAIEAITCTKVSKKIRRDLYRPKIHTKNNRTPNNRSQKNKC